MMNTVSKGNKFEEECHTVILEAIQKGSLGSIPEQCKVHKKPGYYSKDRESNIIFDLSIEVWPPDSKRYSLLYLIECKDYSSTIPVSDLEEFYAKAIQVSGANMKAVFITSSTLQDGAHSYARSKGMMLIEVNQNLTFNIVFHKAARHSDNQLKSELGNLDTSLLVEFNRRQTCRQIDKALISGFVSNVLSTEIEERPLPQLSADTIECITEGILQGFRPSVMSEGVGMSFNELLLFLKSVYGLEVKHQSDLKHDLSGRPILASTSFSDKTIFIHSSLVNTNRYRFIVAHEIGHFFLHNKLQISRFKYEALEDSKQNFALGTYVLENDRNWIEWQANQFASTLLMPKMAVLRQLGIQQDKLGRRTGVPLYVDDQRCNENDFHEITKKLAAYFGTSKTSVIYRLNSLKMITFNSRMKSVGQILNEFLAEL